MFFNKNTICIALSTLGVAISALECNLKTHPTAPTVGLGTAGNYAILTKAGVTTTGNTSVNGNVGVSPIAETSITGFALTSAGTYATSKLVNGQVTAADQTSPTPSGLTTAIGNMETAYTDAAGRTGDCPELFNGILTDQTLTPGVYKWSGNVGISGSLTFKGNSNDVWILIIAQDLKLDNGAEVVLEASNGPGGKPLAENIFWQVSQAADFGSTSKAEGIFLVKRAMTFKGGSSLNGAALAQTAVTMVATTINEAPPKNRS